ncbi:flagellar motor protein MotB [Sphingomonas sp. Leaf226]|uniref:flagellar motor protein MotB n=1 Tax=Sphingomonas sp. Leaf226 TaxID=1735691 RepID=UPI000A7595DE|nr:flagellar motor protein MotB [Sphingomonas sp. Leaf226]
MARAPHGANQPPKIIVKKVYIEGHGGHHGGAWKVAYADFVTAMMAFFLLLWILGATTEKQRKGIADYFAPTLIDTHTLGIGGGALLGGESILSKNKIGPQAGQTSLPQIAIPNAGAGGADTGTGPKGNKKGLDALNAEDRRNFDAMRRKVLRQIEQSKNLSRLASHIRFVPTQDGMRIDLIDDADYSMFAMGTTALDARAGDLIGMIAGSIAGSANPIMIRAR